MNIDLLTDTGQHKLTELNRITRQVHAGKISTAEATRQLAGIGVVKLARVTTRNVTEAAKLVGVKEAP
jgi:uncharacterized membrane protein YjjP (DUF1212 family)